MTTQYMQTANCEATELDGEWIILNPNQYTITKLNDIGGFCWSLLSDVQTVESMTQLIMEKFPAVESERRVKKDIEVYLEHLLQCGLIQYAD
jgi:hypothetical protein